MTNSSSVRLSTSSASNGSLSNLSSLQPQCALELFRPAISRKMRAQPAAGGSSVGMLFVGSGCQA